jgi:hypothetical protein
MYRLCETYCLWTPGQINLCIICIEQNELIARLKIGL